MGVTWWNHSGSSRWSRTPGVTNGVEKREKRKEDRRVTNPPRKDPGAKGEDIKKGESGPLVLLALHVPILIRLCKVPTTNHSPIRQRHESQFKVEQGNSWSATR